MNLSPTRSDPGHAQGGIELRAKTPNEVAVLVMDLTTWLSGFELHTWAQTVTLDRADGGLSVQCTLQPSALEQLMPGHDTLGLHQRLSQTKDDPADWTVEREIAVALLGSPQLFSFANLAALQSHIRVRRNMVLAARKTALAFKTEAAERPEADWRYLEGPGFILNPGRPLIDALVAATQPEATGKLYDFSCYRATEYVILLGIAQELAAHHPRFVGRFAATQRTARGALRAVP